MLINLKICKCKVTIGNFFIIFELGSCLGVALIRGMLVGCCYLGAACNSIVRWGNIMVSNGRTKGPKVSENDIICGPQDQGKQVFSRCTVMKDFFWGF